MKISLRTIILFFPLVLTAVLYYTTFRELYWERWMLLDYGHAPFILPISIFVTIFSYPKFKSFIEKPSSTFNLGGLGLAIFSLWLFGFSWQWNYLSLQTFSLIPLLAAIAWFFFGSSILRSLSFPLLYLLLLVPLPVGILDNITLPMRYFTSISAHFILKLAHYPMTRNGLLLNLNEHEIFLGAPCSGLRSMITMLSLGLLYVYFKQGKWTKNLILLFSIIPLALFGNVVRVIIICLITFYLGDKAGQGFLHEFSGMVVFLIMILGLMAMENFVNRGQK